MEEAHERLKDARIKAGYDTAQDAANAFGWKISAYRHHENGTRAFKADVAQRYAKAYRVTAEYLLWGKPLATATVPLVGYIGAGAEHFYFDDHERGGSHDRIEAPPDCPKSAVAVQIRGTSMFPVYNDGDILIYDERRPDVESMLHRRCVCWLSDGRILVKTVTPGNADGFFTLTSFNAPPIQDVVVEYVARIVWVKPR